MESNQNIDDETLEEEKLEDAQPESLVATEIEEKRILRRKRRRKNQILVYIAVFSFIILLGVSITGGILFLTREKTPAIPTFEDIEQDLEALDEQLEDVLGDVEIQVEIVPEKTDEEKIDEVLEEMIAAMPLEDKVAGLFIVSPDSFSGFSNVVRAGETTQSLMSQYAIGGMVYFSNNIQSASQLSEMIANTISYSKYPLFFAIDEEGGSVSRLGKSGLAEATASAQAIGETADTQQAYDAGAQIARNMAEYGLNLNFAPVADMDVLENNSLGDRVFGSDTTLVGDMVSAMVTGLEDNGISSCMKHFPGIGSTLEDTHQVMAVSERTLEEFKENEFLVFQAGIDAGADFIMIGHMSVPNIIGDNTPSSLSPMVVTELLRTDLGYDGVVITDALNMTSITEYYTNAEAAVLALKAGCDMILMPDNFVEAYEGILDAVAIGVISEERINDALKRIYRIKYVGEIEV